MLHMGSTVKHWCNQTDDSLLTHTIEYGGKSCQNTVVTSFPVL